MVGNSFSLGIVTGWGNYSETMTDYGLQSIGYGNSNMIATIQMGGCIDNFKIHIHIEILNANHFIIKQKDDHIYYSKEKEIILLKINIQSKHIW